MLLRALYDLASERRLLDSVHLQNRTVHVLIPINFDGVLEGDGVIPLYSKDDKGKDRLGQDRRMPRFPGENNGGKAYFLAESCSALFGIDKGTGEGHPLESGRLGNPVKSFRHFWEQVGLAYQITSLPSLAALLKFCDRYLYEEGGRLKHRLPFIETRQSKTGKLEVGALTSTRDWERLAKATLTFQIGGDLVFNANPDAPLTQYWKKTYCKEAFSENAEEEAGHTKPKVGLCLITERVNVPIARSHKPKILRIPNIPSGGYLVSFAKECPAFSSYGFEMGENAPVSEEAASSYLLALQALLDSENNSLRVGPMVVCFWAKKRDDSAGFFAQMLKKPDPLAVSEFLKSPWAGVDRHAAHLDDFYSITLSGNAVRVVVRHWMQTTVEGAIERLRDWFRDLQTVAFGHDFIPEGKGRGKPKGASEHNEEELPPLSIIRLANATVRDPKDLKADVASHLYQAALEGTPVPISLAKPVLDRLRADIPKYGLGVLETPISWRTVKAIRQSRQPIPPPGVTRFALLKLILNRNRKEGDPMPEIQPEVFETDDPAYNCGRLLAVLAEAQAKAHEYKLEGAGVAERYFGTASVSPSSVFPLLLRLNRHHLNKIRKSDRFGGHERFLEDAIQDILIKFRPEISNQPPRFPRLLDLQAQGRFAIGFYQQKAESDARKAQAAKDKEKKADEQ